MIGGTSHTGKSTLTREVAAAVGGERLSTDSLGRHPGRPWGEVPDHVVTHYRTSTVDQLVAAQLRHYDRLWPAVVQAIEPYVAGRADVGGLVLEGSGVWPDHVARLRSPHVAAFWLTADAATIRARIRRTSRFTHRTPHERMLIEKFVGRTLRYDVLLRDALRARGMTAVDSACASPSELVEQLLGEALPPR